MASISATIEYLNQLPEQIRETGINMVRSSILSHGHYRSGTLYDSVQGAASSENVRIRCWCKYASYVNSGRGAVRPKHYTKNGHLGSLRFEDGSFHRYAGPYAGSRFFDTAANQLRAYISTL